MYIELLVYTSKNAAASCQTCYENVTDRPVDGEKDRETNIEVVTSMYPPDLQVTQK